MATAKKETEKLDFFSKDQICKAKKYQDNIDIVTALLDDGKKYTFEQVDKIIDDYMKGKVN